MVRISALDCSWPDSLAGLLKLLQNEVDTYPLIYSTKDFRPLTIDYQQCNTVQLTRDEIQCSTPTKPDEDDQCIVCDAQHDSARCSSVVGALLCILDIDCSSVVIKGKDSGCDEVPACYSQKAGDKSQVRQVDETSPL